MDNRLKERLTGAAILVALVVLLVPEIFRGHGSAPAAGASASGSANTGGGGISGITSRSSGGGDAPPVRSYTFDLNNSSPAASGAAVAGDQHPVQHQTEPQPRAQPQPQAPAESQIQPKPEAQPQPHGRPEAQIQVRAKVPAPQAGPANAVAAARPAKTAPVVAVPQRSEAGGWEIQLGVFSRRDNAQRLAKRAQASGFSVSITPLGGAHSLFRVHSAARLDRAEAEALQQRLKSDGFATSLMRR